MSRLARRGAGCRDMREPHSHLLQRGDGVIVPVFGEDAGFGGFGAVMVKSACRLFVTRRAWRAGFSISTQSEECCMSSASSVS
jgi:hypothetical protein